jgi:N-acetylmuramoyl-L-alanine amidase
MSNRRRGVYDSGATFGALQEATIAMDWANEFRAQCITRGFRVVRTRRDAQDPAPVWRRDDIAYSYGGAIMLSFHCNSGGGHGAEVFYRGSDDRQMAVKLSALLASKLGIPDRGAKTEADSQHPSLAVMEFDKCWLMELGFIDHPVDRAKMVDRTIRTNTCSALADLVADYLK